MPINVNLISHSNDKEYECDICMNYTHSYLTHYHDIMIYHLDKTQTCDICALNALTYEMQKLELNKHKKPVWEY